MSARNQFFCFVVAASASDVAFGVYSRREKQQTRARKNCLFSLSLLSPLHGPFILISTGAWREVETHPIHRSRQTLQEKRAKYELRQEQRGGQHHICYTSRKSDTQREIGVSESAKNDYNTERSTFCVSIDLGSDFHACCTSTFGMKDPLATCTSAASS